MTSKNQIQICLDQEITDEPKKQKKTNSSALDAYFKKWSVPQNILYGRYLKTHMAQMRKKKNKKCGKFAKMSNFIGSKSQNQCRSHHQKMLLTFGSLQRIIEYVSEVKKRGELITLQQYQHQFCLNKSKEDENKATSKIEEQPSTERQSQQQVKSEVVKVVNGMRQSLGQSMGLPIRVEQSRVSCDEDGGIFDVLEVNGNYDDYFHC